MEIKAYNENQGWEVRNLNELISEIHDVRLREGIIYSNTLTLFNVTFKIRKNPYSNIMMDINVRDRDGEKGLKFLKQEFKEWVAEEYHNPGEAWKEYPERWRPLLNANGKMDYSYNQRIHLAGQLENIIKVLTKDPSTRQAYISIYNAPVDSLRIGESEMIPCILGYQFTQVDQDLNMTVMARSIDANNCLMNDIWLADRFLNHIVEEINRKVEYKADRKVNTGSITFMISNLHSYPDIVQKEIIR